MNSFKLEEFLKQEIKHSKIEIIGKSVLEKPIYAVVFDFGNPYSMIIQAAIHAREHITCDLVCKMIKEISDNFDKYKKQKMPNLVFVPLSNPDGADIATLGLKAVKSRNRRKFLLEINNQNKDFSLYKANANGVDLNTNFDARWGTGKANLFYHSPHGFVGEIANSEPCTKALITLTEKIKPIFTISYHCKGEEIYYDFFARKENLKRDKKIAKIVKSATHYKIVSAQNSSSGGYKDWCIEKLNIPAVTIEVGSDKLSHPLGENCLEKIWKQNKNLLKKFSKIAKEYEHGRKSEIHEKSTCSCEKSI